LRGIVGIPAVGIDAIPPPASGLPARLVLGPALRAQSDRRLVRLVCEGYESAFEEIVRRYRRPLDRFAAGIVGGRSEDVTQDSFRKALEALRHGDSEVELRPWLYRIVRNTALNDLRDRPPAAAQLAEDLVGGARSAAAEAEERAEVAALTARMRALPENQRAALVMRELEGMSHEEIAAALGISGGAARQAIARARTTVRSGFGALVPLPLLRALSGGSDGAAEAVGAGAAGAGVAGSAAGGAGVAAGGAAVGGGSVLGSGMAAIGGGFGAGALKVGLATVAVAGSIGAGVAIDHHGATDHPSSQRPAASAPGGPGGDGVRLIPSRTVAEIDDHSSRSGHSFGEDRGGVGPNGRGRDHGGHGGSGRSHDGHGSGGGDASGGPGPSSSGDGGGSGRGGPGDDLHQSGPGVSGHDDSASSDHSGSGSGDGDGSRHGGGGSGSGDGSSGGGDSRGGSGSGSSTSTRGGHGSDDAAESVVGTVPAAPSTSGGSESSSSGSGSSASSGSSGGSGSSDDSPTTSGDSSSSSGSSGGPSPSLDTPIVTEDGSGSGGGSGSSGGS
jgi:RNA polymerase sigma factor (sigma-70 family)